MRTMKAQPEELSIATQFSLVFRPSRSASWRQVIAFSVSFGMLLSFSHVLKDSSIIGQQRQQQSSPQRPLLRDSLGQRFDGTTTPSSLHLNPRSASKSLRLGDLPGYSGWARPPYTLARYFRLATSRDAGLRPTIGQPFTLQIQCDHTSCHRQAEEEGGPLFFARAYGPSILPGVVTQSDHSPRGSYDITFLFWDLGVYHIEVVLTFSHTPVNWLSRMPFERDLISYEGYLLPDFPMTIELDGHEGDCGGKSWLTEHSMTDGVMKALSMSPSASTTASLRQLPILSHPTSTMPTHEHGSVTDSPFPTPLCRHEDMVVSSWDHALWKGGRWKVVESVVHGCKTNAHGEDAQVEDGLDVERFNIAHSQDKELLVQSYQSGLTSIGFRMDYQYLNCSLLPPDQLRKPGIFPRALNQTRLKFDGRPIHVLFIGDSNLREQKAVFDTFFGGLLSTELVSTSGGLIPTLPDIRKRLNTLAKEKLSVFVLFNSGLHDIDKLCVAHRRMERQAFLNVTDGGAFSCLEHYLQSLTDFLDVVSNFPAILRVWQTTSAGWPKWGVYGVAWPVHTLQPLPTSPNAVEHFNRHAWEVLDLYIQTGSITVMDTFWITLSRPDHRQIDVESDLGRHLVHAGVEVYDVLARQWAMMILEAFRAY